jgi:hypothetical protein
MRPDIENLVGKKKRQYICIFQSINKLLMSLKSPMKSSAEKYDIR